jgi:DnaJ-domain-containing protein 1
MIFYAILLLVVLLGLIFLILTVPPRQTAAFLTNAGPIIMIVAGGALTLFQRGFIGVPLVIFGLSWWRRNQSQRPLASPGGRKSTVRSAYLEMELDHDTGEIDGTVLAGRLKGARLSSFNEEEVLALYQEIRTDEESTALLESFLDRYHTNWREHFDHGSSGDWNGGSGFNNMTKEEAYQVLGLDAGASKEDIHQAWRRLIKGVHPDSGGSAFLAAKINAAREVLLG